MRFHSYHIYFSNGITVDSLDGHLYKTDTSLKWSLFSYTPFLTLCKTETTLCSHLEWAPKVSILKKVDCRAKNLMMVKQLQT